MPKIAYSNELKLLIIKLYNEGFEASYLAKEYNIKSGPQLIKLWVSKYNEGIKDSDENLSCRGDFVLKKEISSKLLLIEIEKLRKDILKKDKEILTMKIEKEFMEKCMPSCMSYSQNQVKMIQATREYKYKVFILIYEIEFRKIISITKMCKIANVSRSKYQLFKKTNKLFNKIQCNNFVFDRTTLPEFNSKVNYDVKSLIEDFFEENPISSGARNIKIWIFRTSNIRISVETILKYTKSFTFKFKSPFRAARKHKKGKDNMQNNIKRDLIGNNFSTNSPGEIVGFDGTYFTIEIAGKKIDLLCEIAYDLYSRKIVGWKFGKTENSDIVLDVVKQIELYCQNNNFDKTIIQSDRGRANASNKVKEFEGVSKHLVHSMSSNGFKHNAPTESMNGWVKSIFIKTYGSRFISVKSFIEAFNNFVLNRNKIQELKY